MQGRLLYSSSAVETKDIEMVARELTLIYNTFAYAMTQLGLKANIYSRLISRREKRKVELMDYWGTLPDDWVEYMGVKQFFEARLTPARCVAGIAPELFQRDVERNSNMTRIMRDMFSMCMRWESMGTRGYRYWGNFWFSKTKGTRYEFINKTNLDELNDLRLTIRREEHRPYWPGKITALRLGANQPRVLNHYTPVIRYLWKILGKISRVAGKQQRFLTNATGISLGSVYEGSESFEMGTPRCLGQPYLIRLLRTLNCVETGVLAGGYSIDVPIWNRSRGYNANTLRLYGYIEGDCRKSVHVYYYTAIVEKRYTSEYRDINTRHLFSLEQLYGKDMPCYQNLFKLNIEAVHANIPASLLMMKEKSKKLAEIPLEKAFKAYMLSFDTYSLDRDFINGPYGFPEYAFKDYLMYGCSDADLGSWLTLLITGIRSEYLCLGLACQGFQKWAIENDLVSGNEDILQIFNKIGEVAEKMALQKIPAYYLKILQSWEDNSDGFSSLKGWEGKPITYEL